MLRIYCYEKWHKKYIFGNVSFVTKFNISCSLILWYNTSVYNSRCNFVN